MSTHQKPAKSADQKPNETVSEKPQNNDDILIDVPLEDSEDDPGRNDSMASANTEEPVERSADPSPELSAAQDEIARLKDAFLRAKAEQDNLRRRSEKEVSNSRKFAVEGFARELLQVRDSLKLALQVELAEEADDVVKGMYEGVNITLKQLDSAFVKFALTEIAPEAGDKLDPNLHQAMSIVESEEVESGRILNVIQVGFQIHDRLLRPAMVVVAK